MQLLLDYLPVIAFFGAYVATKDIFLAVVVIMVVAPIVLTVQWFMTRKLNKLTAWSTGLVVAFGGITLLLDNPVFIYWKPTVFYWTFALACLISHFVGDKTIVQRMLQAASKTSEVTLELPPQNWRTLNLMWVVFALIAGALNIHVAYSYSESTWVNFKLFGLLGLTLVFLVVQAIWMASVMEHEAGPDSEA
ncbi:MAG: inner membrane-spanning protein YciB [Woeseiaceae bacterium]|nr:inner membrane-spanning protein YciB [Woeseiaceae bacterium]